MFEFTDYAKARLTHSVIMYDGYPYRVQKVTDDRTVDCFRLEDAMGQNNLYSFLLDAPEMSYQPPQLGYINLGRGATFFKRHPVRYWKHGLSLGENVFGMDHSEFYSQATVDCILGVYPSLVEAFELSQSFVKPVAFHKLMAVSALRYLNPCKCELFFKGRFVGILDVSQIGDVTFDQVDSILQTLLRGVIQK